MAILAKTTSNFESFRRQKKLPPEKASGAPFEHGERVPGFAQYCAICEIFVPADGSHAFHFEQ